MTVESIIKLVTDAGFGIASFAALIYGGYKLLQWLEEVKTNHLAHIQESLNRIVEVADSHSEKLDRLVEQTKK